MNGLNDAYVESANERRGTAGYGSHRNREKAAGVKAEARGKAKVRPWAQPPLEKVRHKAQKNGRNKFRHNDSKMQASYKRLSIKRFVS